MYKKLKSEIEAGKIGDVKFVNVNFGFDMHDKSRIVQKSLGGGVLLDLGCYGVQFAQLVFGERPHKIVASGTLNQDGMT